MARHRRNRLPWFRLRSGYRILLERHRALLKDYEALQSDHRVLLAQTAAEDSAQTSWGLENEQTGRIPVITDVGLDPDKTDSLVRRTGLLDQPGGAWSVTGADRG